MEKLRQVREFHVSKLKAIRLCPWRVGMGRVA